MLATGSPDGMIRLISRQPAYRSARRSSKAARSTHSPSAPTAAGSLPAAPIAPFAAGSSRAPSKGHLSVSCWVSVTTDLEFDGGDAIRRMDGATSWDRRRRLGELGGAPLR